jgi:ATP-binding protein involved in chromosome partitioning
MTVTEKDILTALSHVEEPDLKKDLVTLNMVKDIRIEGNHVSFTVVLTTPACPLKDMIRNACINAVHVIVSKDLQVTVNMTANVTAQNQKDARHVPGIKNIVTVGSGKGGVGKSTVSANLAIALAQQGAKVGLLDADVYGPSVPIMFDLLDERLYMMEKDGKDWFIPFDRYGIKVMSMGFMVPSTQAVVLRGPVISKALNQMIRDSEWGELDYLIIDLPPGTGDIAITLATDYSVTGGIIVTTPQPVAVADARKAAEMFLNPRINIPLLGVVENMSYFTPPELPNNQYFLFGRGGGNSLAQTLNIPLLGEIPIVESIRQSGDDGKPVATDPNSKLGKIFAELASKTAQQVSLINAQKREAVLT